MKLKRRIVAAALASSTLAAASRKRRYQQSGYSPGRELGELSPPPAGQSRLFIHQRECDSRRRSAYKFRLDSASDGGSRLASRGSINAAALIARATTRENIKRRDKRAILCASLVARRGAGIIGMAHHRREAWGELNSPDSGVIERAAA